MRRHSFLPPDLLPIGNQRTSVAGQKRESYFAGSQVHGRNPHFIPQLQYLLLRLGVFFYDFSSPQVPFTDFTKQIILSNNEKQPPLGTKPTAALWPQGNIMHKLRIHIKRADWIDRAQATKPLYFIERLSITTAQ